MSIRLRDLNSISDHGVRPFVPDSVVLEPCDAEITYFTDPARGPGWLHDS